jgi:hypothetical protein
MFFVDELRYSDLKPQLGRDLKLFSCLCGRLAFVTCFDRAVAMALLADQPHLPARHHFSQAERPDQSAGEPGFSFQFGRTSTRRPEYFEHFSREPKDGTSAASPQIGIAVSPGLRTARWWTDRHAERADSRARASGLLPQSRLPRPVAISEFPTYRNREFSGHISDTNPKEQGTCLILVNALWRKPRRLSMSALPRLSDSLLISLLAGNSPLRPVRQRLGRQPPSASET